MEPILPIGPRDRDVEPVLRVRQAPREGRKDERPDSRERETAREQSQDQPEEPPVPYEGDDGGPHIDVRV
jgi:hypothetical protein